MVYQKNKSAKIRSMTLWFMFLLLLNLPLLAQIEYFQHFDIYNGLSQSDVTNIEQDQYGYMWFGTRGGGISRFDGRIFKNYKKENGLISNNILSLEFDQKGLMYISTPNGIFSFNGTFSNLIGAGSFGTDIHCNIISDTAGQVFAIFENGRVARIDQNQLVEIPLIDKKRDFTFADMTIDSQGNLLIASLQGEIFNLNNNEAKLKYSLPQGLLLKSILADKKNNIWIGTDGGLYKNNGKSLTINIKSSSKILSETALEISETERGDIWIGVESGAIQLYNGQKKYFNKDNGFTNMPVIGFHESSDNVFWFITSGDGIYKYSEKPITKLYNSPLGFQKSILSLVLLDNNQLYISYLEGGLQIYDIKKQRYLKNPNWVDESLKYQLIPINSKEISVFTDNNNIGRILNGVYYDINLGKSLPLGSTVLKVCASPDPNEFSFATNQGFYHYYYGKTSFSKNKRNNQNMLINNMLNSTEGVIYTDQVGVRLFNNDKIVNKALEIPPYFKIFSAHIFDNKYIALGSLEDGVLLFDWSNTKPLALNIKTGLSSNLANALQFDQNGILYIGTEKGLNIVEISDKFEVKKIQIIDEYDGLSSKECNPNSIVHAQNGTFIGTVNGVFYLNNTKNTLPPCQDLSTIITKVGVPYSTENLTKYGKLTNSWFERVDQLKLPTAINEIEFNYQAINHNFSNKIYYYYKLNGFDTRWNGPTTEQKIVYTNLPSGVFTFELRAEIDSQIKGPVTKYSFTIETPFYKKTWFILLVCLALVATILLGQQLYLKSKTQKLLNYLELKQNTETMVKKQIAEDFHDELGNRLAAIKMRSTVLNMKYNGSESDEKRIAKEIDTEISSLFNDTKDFIWAIDPESSQLKELILYIKDNGQALLQNTPIQFKTEINLTDYELEKHLLAGYSMQILMVMKEALTNCIKHSQCTQIVFLVSIENETIIHFKIIDNGMGFLSKTDSKRHKGLQNMERRATKIGMKIHLESGIGTGTVVALSGNFEGISQEIENNTI